ncbi:MAG: phosphotransferase family protein, partial [Nocardioidaceae bacterium]
MTAAGLWDPAAVEALTRLDPTLARPLATRPTDSRPSSWRLHDVRWTPGQHCHFTYRVAGDGPPTFVSEWLTPDGWTTQDFVDDTALPGLTRATDPLLLASRLGGLCKGPIRSCRVEAVRYRPGLRCVLRYDVETATTRHTLYAKVFQPEVFARLAPMAVALAGRPTAGAMVPQLGEIWSDLKILVGWGVSGRSVSAVFADDRIPCGERPELGYRLGELLARFHALAGVAAPTWSEDDQLTGLERAMPAVEAADPDFAARLRTLLDTLAAAVPCSRQDVLAHGSFRPGQVIVSEDGHLTVLDTDEVCRSDRGLDLGVALAHLRWQGVRQPLVRDGLRRIERQLLAGYRRVAGPVDEDMLLWWRAAG